MKLGLIDMRARCYKVTERIFNPCPGIQDPLLCFDAANILYLLEIPFSFTHNFPPLLLSQRELGTLWL